MPINDDLLNKKANVSAKRPAPNTERQRDRANEVQDESGSAVTALARAGVNGMNAQVFAFDTALTQFEDRTADQLVERLRQSPTRIQQKVAARMQEVQPALNQINEIFAEVLEVVDICSLPSAEESRMLGGGF